MERRIKMKDPIVSLEQAQQAGLDLADDASIKSDADVLNACDANGIVSEPLKKAVLDAWNWAQNVKAEFEKPNIVDTLWKALDN